MSLCGITCFAQNKLTRNQILNAVRTHQQNVDSISVSIGDSVLCDSMTTKITLEVLNDSTANNLAYKLTFTKDEIEVEAYNSEDKVYHSTFEYTNSSYEKLKVKVNQHNLRKIDSCDDTVHTKENDILRLYKGGKSYISVESYNGRTNVTTGFHELIGEIKRLIPEIPVVLSLCEEFNVPKDSTCIDTLDIILTLSENFIKFKSKGGEFKKIKVSCNEQDDWEIIDCPKWVLYSKNNNNEIIFESLKNDTKKERIGVVKIGCLGNIKEIQIIQT